MKNYFNRVLLKNLARKLQDPRRSARVWKFSFLINTVVKGMLSGCRNLRELEFLTAASGRRIPDTTVGDFLSQLPVKSLERVLVDGVKEASRKHELDRRELPIRLTVIDGKCLSTAAHNVGRNWLRRSQKGCSKYVAMALRAFFASSELKLHLAQAWIPKGTNERGAFASFLENLIALYGRTKLLEVISVDAGITSIKNAKLIRDAGLHYIMALKNAKWSKMTQEAIELLARTETAEIVQEERIDGKRIIRKLFRSAAPCLAKWQHAREVWRIEKTTWSSKGIATENHYYVTSLPRSRLSNRQVLKAIRLHWSIENNANWVMDTAWKEDRNPWCNKALDAISHIRMIAYNAVARFRARRLRSALAKRIPWKHVLSLIKGNYFPFSEQWATQFA